MCEKLSKAYKDKFVETYSEEYYKRNPKNIEDFIEREKLKNGILDKYVVAWKAGRLKSLSEGDISSDSQLDLGDFEDPSNYKNGYGRDINKDLLNKYLTYLQTDDFKEKVKKETDGFEHLGFEEKVDCFRKLYESFLEKMPSDHNDKDGEKKLPNFGSVYIINLIYFATRGIMPIYDQFAHKAVKALYADVSPNKIYVGPAPDKKETDKVVALYREYMWLLDKVFGKISIERKTDQALWEYGHKKPKFGFSM